MYLREGKAPSAALRPAFARFRAWLRALYEAIVGHPYFKGVQLNDDIRGVFDRLLASEQAIEQAEAEAPIRPVWLTQEASKLNDADWTAYQTTLADAHAARVERLEQKLLKEWFKEQSAFWEAETEKTRTAVVADLSQEPVYVALAALKKNQRPDGTALPAELHSLKLDRAALAEAYGQAKPDPKAGAPMTVAEREALQQVHDELDRNPFVPRAWFDDVGSWQDQRARAKKGRGGEAAPPFIPGRAGAAVYWDIVELGPAHPATRGVVQERIASFLRTGKPNVWSERALQVARNRVPAGTVSEPYVAPTALWAKRLQQKGLTQAQGMLPDEAAERFGYDSGDALVRALLEAPTWLQAVDEETTRRMRAQFADPALAGGLADEARQTVATIGQSEVIQAELQALQRQRRQVRPFVQAERQTQQAARREARQAIAEGVLSVAQARAIAQNRVGTLLVRHLKPERFRQAARKASAAAFELAQAGNVEGAIEEKSRELIATETVRAVYEAERAVEEAIDTFKTDLFKKDATLAKTRNMDFVVVARNIVGAYLYPMDARRRQVAVGDLEKIRQYDNDLYELLAGQIDEATANAQDYRGLTYDQFIGLRDTVLGLWTQARRSEQFLLDGRLHASQAVGADIVATLQPFAHAEPSWSENETRLYGAQSALTIVEHWTNALDKNDPNGLMSRVIYHPIKEGATAVKVAGEPLYRELVEAAAVIEPTLTKDKIAAPELRSNRFEGVLQSKAQLIGLILHTGNESNLRKLVLGYEWGAVREDGSLDTHRLDAFLARMAREGVLTRADYAFAEKVWGLFERLKPQLQRAHREMYGFYFQELPIAEIQTPFGPIRGGYMPARVDPLRVQTPDRQGMAALANGEVSYAFPTAGRGATRSRVEQYTRPLALDLQLVPAHLDWALRFIHLEPRIKDLGRLLRNHDVVEALNAVNPSAINGLLLPWLSRTARQVISERTDVKMVDRFAKALRTRTTLQQMTLNVINIIQQPLGAIIGATKVSPRYLRDGAWHLMTRPKQMAAFVTAHDPFMATHLTQQVGELRLSLDRLLVGRGRFQAMRDFGSQYGLVFQQITQHATDLVVWHGAYHEALAQQATDAEAVRAAGSAVRLTQGSYTPEDLARFEVTAPFSRLFTIYSHYFNNLANLTLSEYAGALRTYGISPRVVPRLLYATMFTLSLGAIFNEVLVRALSGRPVLPPDEDDPESWLWPAIDLIWAGHRNLGFAMVPAIGPLARATYGKVFTKEGWDDDVRASPAISVLDQSIRGVDNLYDQAHAVLTGEERPPLAVRDILTLIGMVSGLPTGAAGKPAQYLYDVDTGTVEPPANLKELGQGLISGRAPQPAP
ncbi:MAG: hypothetical protein WAY02_07345 [Burkholderiaceae bacterium]